MGVLRIKRMKMSKKALITGITGQDGAYLAEFYSDDLAKLDTL